MTESRGASAGRAARGARAAISWILTFGLILSGPTATSWLRWEVPDENYFLGYLAWKDGKGKIRWDPAIDSDDPGGLRDAGAGLRSSIGGTLRALTVGQTGKEYEFIEEFVSEPLPRTLYLNVSRLIQVDMYYKHQSTTLDCPRSPLVELWVGQDYLAGQLVREILWYGPYIPNAPAGYCNEFFRMQAGATVIPAGSIIRLTLSHPGPVAPAYGLGTGHRSLLRFPLFTEVEAIYREVDAKAAAGADANNGPAFAMALAGLGAIPGLRRRRELLAAMLLVGGLSGCLAEPSSGEPASNARSSGGSASATILPTLPAGGEGGNGSILGLVHDDLGVLLRDAHFSLLGTDRSAQTDGAGRFSLLDVPPGQYEFRTDRAGYRSYEGKVEVRSKATTRLDITLVPLAGGEGDSRSHRHDMFPPSGRLDLGTVDVPFSTSSPTVCFSFYNNFCPSPEFRLAAGTSDKPMIIPPGTEKLEYKVDWDPAQNRVEQVGLSFFDNNKPYGPYGLNLTFMGPRKNGEVGRIATTWEMTDSGHQVSSSWGFRLFIPSGTSMNPGPIAQPFRFSLTAIRGAIPMEPAHRDFWGPNQTVVVLDKASLAVESCLFGCVFPRTESTWQPVSLVPPGTTWIEARLESEKDRPLAPAWSLAYRSADQTPPPCCGVGDYRMAEPAGTDGSSVKLFRIRVEPGESDPFYARKSGWIILLDDSGATTNTYGYYPDPPTFKFRLTLTAHRDAVPT